MNETCIYYEECRNKENALKCCRCENNSENFEEIEKYSMTETPKKTKGFYRFKNNYDPL